jgi:hypothetical protein
MRMTIIVADAGVGTMKDYKKLKPLEIEMIRLLNKAYDAGYEDGKIAQTTTIIENLASKVERIKKEIQDED